MIFLIEKILKDINQEYYPDRKQKRKRRKNKQ